MGRLRLNLALSMTVVVVTAAAVSADEARPASRAQLAEDVASRVIARTPLADSGLDRPIRAEFVEIVSKYGPPRPSAEFARGLLDGLDAYLQKVYPDPAQLADPVRRDEAYLGLLPEIRDLQWKLYLAVGRRPLDAAARDRLEEQHDWMRKHIRSLPYPALLAKRPPPRDEQVRDRALADLEAKIDDILCPSFKSPLSDDDFDAFQDRLAEYKPEDELLYVVPHIVFEEARLQFNNPPGAASPPRLKTFNEKPVSFSQFNGTLSLGFASSAAARGIYNRIDSYRQSNGSFIDLGDDPPGVRAIPRPPDANLSSPPTLEELDLLFEGQGWGRGALVCDEKELRLIGINGTKLVPLDVRRWIEVDRVPRRQILESVKKRGSTIWKLPEPIDKDAIGNLRYDALAAVLTPTDKLFIIQPREFGHGSFAFHVREHDPLRLGRRAAKPQEDEEDEE